MPDTAGVVRPATTRGITVLVVLLFMLAAVAGAAVLVAVTAFPQRGRSIPNAPRGVNEVLERVSDGLDAAEEQAQRAGVALRERDSQRR